MTPHQHKLFKFTTPTLQNKKNQLPPTYSKKKSSAFRPSQVNFTGIALKYFVLTYFFLFKMPTVPRNIPCDKNSNILGIPISYRGMDIEHLSVPRRVEFWSFCRWYQRPKLSKNAVTMWKALENQCINRVCSGFDWFEIH